MGKQAIIFGATGAVGRQLLELCLDGDRYERITVIARRTASASHPKLDWIELDFDDLHELAPISGLRDGDAFCCLGTTIKAAGSKAMFRRVDYDYTLDAARFSKRCAVKNFSMISAMGADPKSSSFYNRTKGEIEDAVTAEKLNALRILRPSLLKGQRDEFRLAEEAGNIVSTLLSPIFILGLRKYQPIKVEKVARALYETVNDAVGHRPVSIYQSDKLQAY